MQGHQSGAEVSGRLCRMGHGIGDVVIFQVQEDAFPEALHFTHDLRTEPREQLCANLEPLAGMTGVYRGQRFFARVHIQDDDEFGGHELLSVWLKEKDLKDTKNPKDSKGRIFVVLYVLWVLYVLFCIRSTAWKSSS
ncbi:MAG: hypothetical protein BWY09_01630 [Candidatus Hydrogenedentes bacterium ADurb.Bin179]|nr:MAG: hypothetical protein BWY09_01630 [Candidatus Hydrogenedentes bacterium ADurb.Bin179]